MINVYGRSASGWSSHDSTGYVFVSIVLHRVLGALYLCDEVALNIWVQFLEQVARDFCAILPQMLLLQEEVHSQICFVDDGRVLYGEVANARQDEVLECFNTNDARSRVDEEDVGVLERDLTCSSPETQLTVVPALLSLCGACNMVVHLLLFLRGRSLHRRR
jgi:hypothetical protein